jgi:hypothetical protein
MLTYREVWRKSELCVHMVKLRTREFNGNPNFNILEPEGPLHDSTTACVIAQQYSSSTFLSLSFHLCKTKFDALFKNVIISFLFF